MNPTTAMVSDVANTAVKPDAPRAATIFAQYLKEYGDMIHRDKNTTSTMVVGLDHKTFITRCNQSSNKFNPARCDFDGLTHELFKQNEKWASGDLLINPAKKLASLHGWEARTSQARIQSI